MPEIRLYTHEYRPTARHEVDFDITSELVLETRPGVPRPFVMRATRLHLSWSWRAEGRNAGQWRLFWCFHGRRYRKTSDDWSPHEQGFMTELEIDLPDWVQPLIEANAPTTPPVAAREQGQPSTRQPSAPAEELRAAAAKLREMAKGTTRGPWFVADCELYPRWILSSGQTEPDSHYAADVAKSYPDGGGDGVYVTDADWAWTAFAHPGLAEPLAALLDVAASTWDAVGPGSAPSGTTETALTVARVINGSAQ